MARSYKAANSLDIKKAIDVIGLNEKWNDSKLRQNKTKCFDKLTEFKKKESDASA